MPRPPSPRSLIFLKPWTQHWQAEEPGHLPRAALNRRGLGRLSFSMSCRKLSTQDSGAGESPQDFLWPLTWKEEEQNGEDAYLDDSEEMAGSNTVRKSFENSPGSALWPLQNTETLSTMCSRCSLSWHREQCSPTPTPLQQSHVLWSRKTTLSSPAHTGGHEGHLTAVSVNMAVRGSPGYDDQVGKSWLSRSSGFRLPPRTHRRRQGPPAWACPHLSFLMAAALFGVSWSLSTCVALVAIQIHF